MRTVRAECFDWLLILNSRQLDRVLRVHVERYNAERPHRGLALRPPDTPSAITETTTGEIRRNKLGGLLHEYYRAAT